MLCECGCGQETPLCKYSQPKRGYIKGKPLRFVPGHGNRGRQWSPEAIQNRSRAMMGHQVSDATRKKLSARHIELGIRPSPEAIAKSNENRATREESPSWKSGKTITNGYSCVYEPEHPRRHPNGYVYEHIVIAEQKLGRSLTSGEVVHHIDGNKTNNDPNNLMVLPSQVDHIKLHRLQGDMPY